MMNGSHESAGVNAAKFASPRRSRPTTATSTASLPVAGSAKSEKPAVGTPSQCEFDPAAHSTTFLSLDGPRAVRCHTNAGQGSQGTAFLNPAISQGDHVTLRIFCRNKPGRMRYFIGCAPSRFDLDAGQALLQTTSYSLENLKAAPHAPGRPCTASATPCFHTGSTVIMEVDLRRSPGRLVWTVDSTRTEFRVAVDGATRELHAFVSLYNREAVFEVQ